MARIDDSVKSTNSFLISLRSKTPYFTTLPAYSRWVRAIVSHTHTLPPKRHNTRTRGGAVVMMMILMLVVGA